MRLLDIVFYLLRCSSKVTIKELSIRFDVSTKTIQRDLDKLSVLGIPIIIHRGKNGGVEIDKNYIIVKYMLKYDDYESLLLALYICENISDDIEKSLLIDKFKIVDNKRSTDILNNLKEKFIVDIYDDKINTKSSICIEIDKALNKKSYIEIKVNNRSIEILPISYVLRKEGLCLYGYANEYNLILINKITEVISMNKSCDITKIKYIDNKYSLKYIDK